MEKMKRVFTLTLAISMLATLAMAQSYTITGTQTRGQGSNAELSCTAVKITTAASITSVSGDNAGFWINKGSATIKKYWKTNDASAVGYTLQPGTYYVYPNLKEGQNKATVTLKLE